MSHDKLQAVLMRQIPQHGEADQSPGPPTPRRVPDVPGLLLTDLRVAPGHLFRRARQFHDALWLQRVGDAVTPLQFAVLTALDAEPGLNQRELGERVALDKSTIGDLVARLTRRGYLSRRPDPMDARRRILLVTPAGQQVLLRTRPFVGDIGQQMLEPLEREERNELIRLLAKLVFSGEADNATVANRSSRRRAAFAVPQNGAPERSDWPCREEGTELPQ